MDNTQNIISLCTGYGGLELGLRRISPNFRTVAYVEIEAFACANLVAKIEEGDLDAAPIWTDIKTFDGEPFRGKVDGIIGGYPCQPFSNAGQRKGTDDPRHLWPYIEQHIRTIRPVWCFFENVSGHLTLGFEEVFRSLRGMGYAVEAGLFTAAEVGAPHKRERLFILAYDGNGDSRQGSNASMEYCGGFRERQDPKTSSLAGRCGDGELENPNRGRSGQEHELCESDIPTGPSATELAKSISQRAGGESGTPGGENRISVLRQGNGQACTGGAATTGELGDADNQQGRLHASGRFDQTETRSAGEAELGDPKHAGYATKQVVQGGEGTGDHRGEKESPETGKPTGTDRPGDVQSVQGGTGGGKQLANAASKRSKTEPEPQNAGNKRQPNNIEYRGQKWPARPGQEQYPWEEPRTVKSGMGRAVDGFASRVDELRLLGNGVVPQTAELAFRTLQEKTDGIKGPQERKSETGESKEAAEKEK